MYKIDFHHPVSVFFVGIGGISMSGLAEILADAGFRVSGSDRAHSALTDMLEAKSITVFYGQRAENITDDLDVVVFNQRHPSQQSGIYRCPRKGDSLSDKSRASWAAYEKLPDSGCRQRNPWENHYHLHAQPDSAAGGYRPYPLHRRYLQTNRWKYPGGKVRLLCHRSL